MFLQFWDKNILIFSKYFLKCFDSECNLMWIIFVSWMDGWTLCIRWLAPGPTNTKYNFKVYQKKSRFNVQRIIIWFGKWTLCHHVIKTYIFCFQSILICWTFECWGGNTVHFSNQTIFIIFMKSERLFF